MINLFFIPVFNDWCKREIIDDKSQLQKYPSVIKYIIGHRGDKKPVLIVYLRNDDEIAKSFFEKCCSNDTHIEFVHVGKTEEKLKEVKDMQSYEKNAPAIDAPTMNQLNETTNTFGSGFLTASHVAVNGSELLYNRSLLSLNNTIYYQDHDILHPSMEDYNAKNNDNKVGKVVESFIGNYNSDSSFGLDFAVVKCENDRKEGVFFV